MLKRLKKEEKGFTLIELLAVIVILAVIAVIAVPLISNIIGNTKKDADVATARQIYDAARLYVTAEKNGDFTGGGTGLTISIVGGTDSLQAKGYLENPILLPSTKANITGGEVKFSATGSLTSVSLTTVAGGTVETGVTSVTTTHTASSKVYDGSTVIKSGK
nr:prepilin-type N-terminal cleavage/methylation domain-containing protein [Paenibacillus nanensis]